MLIAFMGLAFILLSVYVLWRIIHWLKGVASCFKHLWTQALIFFGYIILSSTIFLGSLLPRSEIQIFIKKISNYWLGTFICIIFFLLLADILVLILKLINKKKKISILQQKKRYYIIGSVVILCSFIFSICGFVHARKVTTRSYDVTVNKKVEEQSSLKIALVADFHMGYSIGTEMIEKMVNIINENDVDLVVVAGDIFDNNYDALDDPEKLKSLLSSIDSKYGVYAVFGNHDVTESLVGGFSIASKENAFRDDRMEQFLLDSNIKVLTDDVTTIANDSIYLIGRLDAEKPGDGTSNRMSIEDMTKDLDKSKPIIEIEHEPAKLQEVSESGVDLMLSGHTHAGQFFPLTLVQPLAWENYNGMLKKNNMYSFVTSGVGIYG
ncbi:MAG: metallophosphoesterase, partial [Clostridiales bacterium]|nr:metallophosphoesterase [Clostridiales bacterium]